MNQVEQIQEKLLYIEEELEKEVPNIATILSSIHKQLKSDPEIVTVLSEEECAVLIRGLKKQTSTEIITSTLKKPGKKALSKVTLDDI